MTSLVRLPRARYRTRLGYEQHDAYRAVQLWCATILQQIEDAVHFPPISHSRSDATRHQHNVIHHHREEARRWLLLPNDAFDEVCELAGLDPEAVRDRAGRLIATRDVLRRLTAGFHGVADRPDCRRYHRPRHVLAEQDKRMCALYRAGMPVAEIAVELGLNANTTKDRLSKLRKRGADLPPRQFHHRSNQTGGQVENFDPNERDRPGSIVRDLHGTRVPHSGGLQ